MREKQLIYSPSQSYFFNFGAQFNLSKQYFLCTCIKPGFFMLTVTLKPDLFSWKKSSCNKTKMKKYKQTNNNKTKLQRKNIKMLFFR